MFNISGVAQKTFWNQRKRKNHKDMNKKEQIYTEYLYEVMIFQ